MSPPTRTPTRTPTLRSRFSAWAWHESQDGTGGATLRAAAVYPLLVVVVVVLGLNWPFMATGLKSVSALWLVSFRLVGAAITLLIITIATRRLAIPSRADYSIIISVAVLRLALGFVLLFSALEIVPPGRSSILMWTSSLWTVPIAVAFIGERMSRLRWAGLVTGVGGIMLVFDPGRLDWSDGRVLLGHGMLLGAAVINASVAIHIRRHRWVATPLGLLPWQMLIAAVPVVAIALAVQGVPTIDWTPQLVFVVVYQGTAASGLALWIQLTVLRSHSTISTNLALMAVPVVGLSSSALLVDEVLTGAVVAGLALVLLGVGVNRVADARA